MKRVISRVAAVSGVLLCAASAWAVNPTCTSDDAYCVATDSATEGNGNPLEALTSKGPFQGIFAIGPKTQGGTPDFYVFLDGNDGLVDPMAGYIGLSAADVNHATLALVGDNKGNFTRGGPNRDLVDLLQSYSPGSDAMQRVTNLSKLTPSLDFLSTPGSPMPAVPNPSTDVLPSVLILLGAQH